MNDVSVFYKVFPGFDWKSVTVTKKEQVIGHCDYIFVEMVGYDYPLMLLLLCDHSPHLLDMDGCDVGKRLVEDAEIGLAV